jgi:hypothetical protein
MAEPVRHRQTKRAATDMFDLQPPRHISTLRVSLLAVRRYEGRLAEPTATAHPAQLGDLKIGSDTGTCLKVGV